MASNFLRNLRVLAVLVMALTVVFAPAMAQSNETGRNQADSGTTARVVVSVTALNRALRHHTAKPWATGIDVDTIVHLADDTLLIGAPNGIPVTAEDFVTALRVANAGKWNVSLDPDPASRDRFVARVDGENCIQTQRLLEFDWAAKREALADAPGTVFPGVATVMERNKIAVCDHRSIGSRANRFEFEAAVPPNGTVRFTRHGNILRVRAPVGVQLSAYEGWNTKVPAANGAPREWAADVTAALAGSAPSKAMKQIVSDFRRVEVFSLLSASGWSPDPYLASEYKLRPGRFPRSVPAVAARAEGECGRRTYVRVGFEIAANGGVGFGVPVETSDIHEGNALLFASDGHPDIDVDADSMARRALKSRPSRHSWVWMVD